MNPVGEVKIHKCLHLHAFAALPDHPITDGKMDCPHCMKIQIIQFESYIDFIEQQEAKVNK